MIKYTYTNKFTDVSKVAELIEQLTPTKEINTNMLMKTSAHIFDSGTHFLLVAYDEEQDNKIVGTGLLRIEYKLSHSGQPSGHIEDVVVDKEYRKRGIGGQIVNILLRGAKYRGCYKCTLNCFQHNVSWYETLGFRQHDFGMRVNFNEQDR